MEKRTQKQIMLEILKNHSGAGISSEGIRSIHWIPQYNRVIKQLRDEDGHVIESRPVRQPDGRRLDKFFYVGQNKARLGSQRHGHDHDGHGNPRFTMDE